MPQGFSILNALLHSVFVGFGIVIPIVALLRTSNLKKLAVKEAFVLTSVQVLRLAGILNFILFCIDAYLQYRASTQGVGNVSVQSPMFGEYWAYYWFSPLMYLLLSQLFWLKKLYIKKAALITLAIMMLILPSQKLLLMLTSFNKDLLPGMAIIPEILLNIIIFIFMVFAVMTATGKVKKLAE